MVVGGGAPDTQCVGQLAQPHLNVRRVRALTKVKVHFTTCGTTVGSRVCVCVFLPCPMLQITPRASLDWGGAGASCFATFLHARLPLTRASFPGTVARTQILVRVLRVRFYNDTHTYTPFELDCPANGRVCPNRSRPSLKWKKRFETKLKSDLSNWAGLEK